MHELHKLRRTASRIVSVFVFMFLMVVTANAYTIVMRGGRRIEIPARFVVTASTITYEASPGVQVTLQMSAIDIPETEKANNEQPGSLLRRTELKPEISSPSSGTVKPAATAQSPSSARTITNRDLETSMRRRRQSEVAYENRRKELGLPTVAESRQQAAAAADAIDVDLDERRAAQKETEAYWRARAEALRTEMAAMDAEIAWIRARLDEGPLPLGSGWGHESFSVTSIVPFISFGNVGRRSSFGNFGGRGFPRHGGHRPGVFVAPGQHGRVSGGHRPGVFVAPRQHAQASGRVGFGGGATRGRVLINPRTFPQRHSGGINAGFGVGVIGSTVGVPAPFYDYSYERSELVTRFNQLAASRAGLNARWRELEEEARRAGAAPGWLRP